ncbi:Uncharacterised protein [Mycobacteroides abscessus subsp. abscessus]|nr:Uncharacterised protein [Mycobacteroides abscessus subsp. abscessus]
MITEGIQLVQINHLAGKRAAHGMWQRRTHFIGKCLVSKSLRGFNFSRIRRQHNAVPRPRVRVRPPIGTDTGRRDENRRALHDRKLLPLSTEHDRNTQIPVDIRTGRRSSPMAR